ncbi:DUF1289 domain-containing protein [Vibrio sp. S4M6]|uniref:DUF1289 domain-containing protein n=1 Tax=Vibrio sinus TaxID=2946865 RepID=UPI00202A9AD1|nr:DUF1289 domain-containing protein [Vibrio sinus]MCL9782037.1 DUF1289 domain-containing protein [Vibrio sinus]
MEQLEFFVVPSPCVGICTVDDKGYCQGCMRKREERFNWLQMSPAQQLHVIKLCRQRYRRKMAKQKTDAQQSMPKDDDIQQTLF